MANTPLRPLRVTKDVVRSWLDRLDQQAGRAVRLDCRRARRFNYRPGAVAVELTQHDETTVAYETAARNLSADGVALIAGKFLYPGTPCGVRLSSPHGYAETIAGTVVRCRYLVGSGSLHEVGIAFTQAVDVTVFEPRARMLRFLLVHGNRQTAALITSFLREYLVSLIQTASESDALEKAAGHEPDLILVDLEDPQSDAFELCQRIRSQGFIGPIVGFAMADVPDLEERCMAAGLTGYLEKPITRRDLVRLAESLMDPPILSSLAGDPAMLPQIEGFVRSLRKRVTQMSIAWEIGDSQLLVDVVRSLRAEAGSYGFENVTEQAVLVHTLFLSEEDPEPVHAALRRLMHLCLKARAGTRMLDRQVIPDLRFTDIGPAS